MYQVTPKPREVEHLAADMTRMAQGMANTISVQLAGGWLPVECVSGVSLCEKCASFSILNPEHYTWAVFNTCHILAAQKIAAAYELP